MQVQLFYSANKMMSVIRRGGVEFPLSPMNELITDFHRYVNRVASTFSVNFWEYLEELKAERRTG